MSSLSARNTVPTPLSPPSRPDGTPLGWLILAMVLVIAPLMVLCEIIAYWRTDVVDDQMFAYYGWRILHGARVYLDVWDNKPPGIYWINALGMLVGGGSYLGVIAMCVAALTVAHVAFFVVASSVYHRGAAALATMLLAFYLMHAYYTGGTNRTETFLVACELTGVAFYMRGFARDRWWKWYAAGLMCGLAFLFKQVGLAAWGAMGVHLIALAITRQLRVRTSFARCLLLLAGAATTVGVAAAALAAQGALREAIFATFGFNRAYFNIGASQFPYNFVTFTLLQQDYKPILLLPLLMAIAAVIHGFLWWLRPQYRPPEIEAPLRAYGPVCTLSLLLFTVWNVAALYGALLSPHAFRHYLVPSIPPLILMVGYLINVLRAEVRLLRRLQQRAWVLVAFILMGYFATEAARQQFAVASTVWVERVELRDPAQWEAIGDAVAEVSKPTDRLQCWGYMPGVYLRARRINATRFTTTEKVGQVRRGAQFIVDELESDLRANPPEILVMSSNDYAWMHGISREAHASQFQLAPWIDEHYALVSEVTRSSGDTTLKRIVRFETAYIFKRRDVVDPAQLPAFDARREVILDDLRKSLEARERKAQSAPAKP